MCGICGLWHFDGQPAQSGVVKGMSDRLAHRGPDGEGMHLDGSLGLGHRRLAILDLTPAGHQPMHYANGRYWIVFNGEVYNFLELRHELEAKGYTFRSDSDTEVILAAYNAWGPACLLRFNGMWAFAIWDSRERTLFLARDRFGVKPLFILDGPQCVAFASEMKAFLALPWFTPRVDWPVFKAEVLDQYSQEGGEHCLWEGVHRLPPGHYALITADSSRRSVRWWQTRDHLVAVPRRLEDQAARFRELFEDACRLRMRSDVPIGTSLSGGLDSSSVVCTVAHVTRQGGQRLAADWQRAFVATFPGTPVDERPYAEMAVARSGVRPLYLEIRPDAALAAVEQTVYHLEQLVGGPLSMLWLIYQAQRKDRVVVTLDGHGGDELLAGYPHYTLAALYDAGSWPTRPRRYLELLDVYRGLLGSPADAGPRRALGQVAWETHAWLRNLRRLAGRARVNLEPQPSANNTTANWLSPDLRQLETAGPASPPLQGSDLFRRTLCRDFHETVFPLILRNYDRMAMAHGVEVRMPFVDWRLVTYVFSLPPESLVGQGYTKLVLRRALADLLPQPVARRRDKIGFAAPVSQWLQTSWRPWLEGVLNDPGFRDGIAWDGRAIAAYAAARTQQGDWTWESWSAVWAYVHAFLWLRAFPRAQPVQGSPSSRT